MAVVLAAACGAAALGETRSTDLEGGAPGTARSQDPTAIEAAFARESYQPGTTARLRFFDPVLLGVRVEILQVGAETVVTRRHDEMHGVPVANGGEIAVRTGSAATIRVGRWPSGLYFARLTSPGRTGYAPFVVAPRGLGQHPVAVVMPTRTWQAYNFRDDDGDGRGDTWYAGHGTTARVSRPFLNRGVPPHFRDYDLRFLHWLVSSGHEADVLAQSDVERASAAELARYRLIVFPGHHEYVTAREHDNMRRYRDGGGNLAFLSANNFFWRVDLKDDVMTRVARWRELGQPESALIGVQYVANDRGASQGPWLVRDTPAATWLFDGVDLPKGAFARGGIEIDATTPASPADIEVVAEIPNLIGGRTAQMTYYETAAGARVFAAGAFTLAGLAWREDASRVLENLWSHMAEDER